MRRSVLAICTVLFAAVSLHAQSFSTQPCKDGDDGDHWFIPGKSVCEVRSATIPVSNGGFKVHGTNGSIEVTGEDRRDIALEARVTVRGGSQSEAESILHEVTIATNGAIEAKGPKLFGMRSWSVSYRLRVPRHVAAQMETVNGSLTLSSIEGEISAETTNGSVHLENLGGKVDVSTTNGGVKANLNGSTWHGSGLSAVTTNGGVSVTLPAGYSAHLVASTTNGGISTSDGGSHHRQLDTTLGSGGPTLRFETTNGGVSIR